MTRKIIVIVIVSLMLIGGLGVKSLFREHDEVIRLPGIVEVQEVRLSSKVGGRVKEIHVREGETVCSGQPLVSIDVPEWEAKRRQVQAQCDWAQAVLMKLRNGSLPEEKVAMAAAWELAKARQLRLRNGNRPEEIDAAQREFEALQAELDFAHKDWEREAILHQQRATTVAQLDLSAATKSRLEGQTNAAKERWQLLAKGSRVEDIAAAEAEVTHAKAQLDLVVRGPREEEIAEAEAKVAENKARLAEIDVMLEEAVIVAPSRALVEVVSVRAGDTLAANQPAVKTLSADDLWVKAYVTEPDLGHVQIGKSVTVTSDTFPDHQRSGRVIYVATASEFTPRNVQSQDERHNQVFAIKIRLDEAVETFKSGMAVEVQLPKTNPSAP